MRGAGAEDQSRLPPRGLTASDWESGSWLQSLTKACKCFVFVKTVIAYKKEGPRRQTRTPQISKRTAVFVSA